MKYLRKIIWCLGLIILTILLRVLFDWLIPDAFGFNHNLTSVIQLVILILTIMNLISGSAVTGKSILKNLLIIFVIFAIPELAFTYWLRHPSKIPATLVSSFRHYYDGVHRNVIQFNPDCSVYDSSLFYTLKPSSKFIYSNIEFSDSFYTNKYGLRDDDSSLYKPDIICLGDSYAMGWGVQQKETYAEQLSSLSGKKVLNAGISSYGTVRELKNLYRLDTSDMQYIIIQYCRNDYEENKEFIDSNYSLKISPESRYRSAVNTHYWTKLWFPGKNFINSSKIYVREKLSGFLPGKKDQAMDTSQMPAYQSAKYFADILLHSTINFKKTKVYVIDVNDAELMNNDFLNGLELLAGTDTYKTHFNDNLILVPVADLLGSNDYYILDTHLRPSGHRKVAERLNSYMFSGK